tara:strand:- start:653 stop:856 length:204 start_codon:yes stop_codon:yes gene_type:complete
MRTSRYVRKTAGKSSISLAHLELMELTVLMDKMVLTVKMVLMELTVLMEPMVLMEWMVKMVHLSSSM